ncbi:MAG: methionine synthase [Crenarchaeota archaeon]|nr:methionine synthase [Thermoproteota archaeon]MDW8033415.1 methionine synthase [Nitrososphaerota archaeon]
MTDISLPVLPTTVIGSYPRPAWLRKVLRLWKTGKFDKEQVEEALNDAVISVLSDQVEAGIDIPSDGEQRRDEMVEYFAERIGGFKFYDPIRIWGNAYYRKPAVYAPLEYRGSIVVREFMFLKSVCNKPVKVTVTGPYTIADWSFNEYYSSKEELTFELAKIINREMKALEEAGAPYVQIDEPALSTHPDELDWAIEAINMAVNNVRIKIGMHVCYGDYSKIIPYLEKLRVSQLALEFANRGFKDIGIVKKMPEDKELGFGVIDVHNKKIETTDEVYYAIKRMIEIFPARRLYINPDCGLKMLPRKIAKEKMRIMVEATRKIRGEVKDDGPVIKIP